MKIKLIDFGLTPGHNPLRVHENDAGADVYMPYDCTLQPGEIVKVPLGFGLILPDGYAGFIFPRSSMAEKGLTCELPPVDSGYRRNTCYHQQCQQQGANDTQRNQSWSVGDYTNYNC